MSELRTLNRRCAGCIYGPDPDEKYRGANEGLHLNPGDHHACHRDDKTGGSHICRGFIDQHPLGKDIEGVDEILERADDADAVNRAWDRAREAHVRHEMVRMARDTARAVIQGTRYLHVEIDGVEVGQVDVEDLR